MYVCFSLYVYVATATRFRIIQLARRQMSYTLIGYLSFFSYNSLTEASRVVECAELAVANCTRALDEAARDDSQRGLHGEGWSLMLCDCSKNRNDIFRICPTRRPQIHHPRIK